LEQRYIKVSSQIILNLQNKYRILFERRNENSTVTLPIFIGKLIIGIFIFDIESSKVKDEKMVLFEIARLVITNSLASAKFFEDSRRSYLESLIAIFVS